MHDEKDFSTNQLIAYYDHLLSPPGVIRKLISFRSDSEILVGDLVLPDSPGPHPAVLSVAGTGCQNRYGDYFGDGKWRIHGTYRHVSDRLAQAGIASLLWDKRGVGASTGGDRRPGDEPGDRDSHACVETDVADAEQALLTLRNQDAVDPNRIAVQGKSAGVYFASLLAARTDLPAAYVFWGGVHRDIAALMECIYGQLEEYCARGPDLEAWVRANLPMNYQLHKHWRVILQAAREGSDVYQAGRGSDKVTVYLKRLKFELANPLADQFRNVKKPTLVIHGDKDYNVPVEDAYAIARELETSGNPDVALVIVPGADHSMQVAPSHTGDELRLRQRLSYSSFQHPMSEFFFEELIRWLSVKLEIR